MASVEGDRMNKTAIWITTIIAVATVISFYLWASHNRYSIITSSEGLAYQVDRKTGKSWALIGDQKIEQNSPNVKEGPEFKLPLDEQMKITGNAGLNYDEDRKKCIRYLTGFILLDG